MGGSVVVLGLGKLCNGEITPSVAAKLQISLEGCRHRGSTTCHDCPLAMEVAWACDYKCNECAARLRCPCGQDRQVRCGCGGRLEILLLHDGGRPRGAHRCVECDMMLSVDGWHVGADEFQEGSVGGQIGERCDLGKMGEEEKMPVSGWVTDSG
jgi:hypothetical protein